MRLDRYSADLWQRLDGLLEAHAPSLMNALQPPASPAAIEAAEVAVGVQFPDEVRAAYLRHDGTRDAGVHTYVPNNFFPPYSQLATLSELADKWQFWFESYLESGLDKLPPTDRRIDACTKTMATQPVWWDRKWIPIGVSNTASVVFVDLHPGLGGKLGQLLTHEGLDEPEVLAGSLNHFIEDFIKRLESKMLYYQKGSWYWTSSRQRTLDWNNPDAVI
jgi:cell wall assembly regulator SMI1